VGSGNIAITGDVQGGLRIVQRGGQDAGGGGGGTGLASARAGASDPSSPTGPELAAIRDLLLAAFTAAELRRLVMYTTNEELRPLVQEFSPNDGLKAMVDRTVAFCLTRDLLPDLLVEVKKANPGQYARFADWLAAWTR
jgi:hypothetical protein